MKCKIDSPRPRRLPALLMGLVAFAGAVAADTGEEEITVVAPRLVQKEVVGTSPSGAVTTELISLTRRVSYADLDLADADKVAELEQRIRDTAKEACDQLAKLYPMAQTTPRRCVDEAVGEAMAQVRRLVPAP